MITHRSRLLRTLLAASTLHLMLAVPSQACPSESGMRTAAANQAAHEMPAPMSHAGHAMVGMHVPAGKQAPASNAPETPAKHHMPCCPPSDAGCQPGACATVAVTMTSVLDEAPMSPHAALPSIVVVRWVSVVQAPEPPPPRI